MLQLVHRVQLGIAIIALFGMTDQSSATNSADPVEQQAAKSTVAKPSTANTIDEVNQKSANSRSVELLQNRKREFDADQREKEDLIAQKVAARAASRQADAAEAGTLIALLGTIFLAWTLWETRRTAAQAKRTADAAVASFDADTKPFLIVRPVDGKSVKLANDRFEPAPILFNIQNAGRGTAIVTTIYRSWVRCRSRENPEPIRAPNATGYPAYRKDVWLPTAPSSVSDEIDSYSELFEFERVGDEDWIYFLGYVEFKDVSERKYVSGFLHLYKVDGNRGLHIALPSSNADLYNYHHEVGAEPTGT